MVFSTLTRGNFFGARVLVPFDHYQSMRLLFFGKDALQRFYPAGATEEERAKVDAEPSEHYWMKSLLSVQADSATVVVWILDRGHMSYLPDKVLKDAFEEVMKEREADRPLQEHDIEFIC